MIFKKKPEPVETEPVEQNENPFFEAASALVELEQNGELPEGFELPEAVKDRAFAELLNEFEPKAAARIYVAERRADEAENEAKERMSEQVRARKALPKSQRTDRAIAPAPDYMTMSKEAFSALEQQYRNAARNGNGSMSLYEDERQRRIEAETKCGIYQHQLQRTKKENERLKTMIAFARL